MKKCALFFLLATWATFAFAGVAVYSPTGGSTASSPVHFAASGSSPNCSKGIGGMGIFTAPYKLAYKVSGSKIDTYLSLSNGTYNTVVQQWDNCGWTATKEVTITVGSGSTSYTGAFSNLEQDSHWNGYTLMPRLTISAALARRAAQQSHIP